MATIDIPSTPAAEVPTGIIPASAEELEIFGEGLSDAQYREDIELYIGQKIIVSSCGIRHFEANGLTIKFANDPVSMDREISLIQEITGLPMSRSGAEALLIPWNHTRLGLINTFVPLDRAVTTIYLPPEQQ
jgi:hypothetical protein